MQKNDGAVESHTLECRNISFVKNISVNKWYQSICNPPINAQFLKDISLLVRAGELHGVIGTAGSGKSTFLNLIADRCRGEAVGRIHLNGEPLTGVVFREVCAFVSFEVRLIPALTVKAFLDYFADLTLSGVSAKDKEERMLSLMHEFDLFAYGHERIGNLTESARRRLIVCMHLLRDPVLILIDDPTRDLCPLSSYQLMYTLNSYVKRNSRMAVIAMRCPRSDIYQLLARITVLFYGEVVYTGYTKQMPAFFRQASYSCPCNENPAVYYLSLATIDRETSERYHETQEQALRLIEYFKIHGDASAYMSAPSDCIYPQLFRKPLCMFGRPGTLMKLFTLTRRCFGSMSASKWCLLSRILLLPLSAILVAFFSVRMPHTSPYTPQSVAAVYFNCMLTFSAAGIFATHTCYDDLRVQCASEVYEGAYNGALSILSYLLACLPLDLFSVILSSAFILWFCNLTYGLKNFVKFIWPLLACFESAQLQSVLWLAFVRNPSRALAIAFAVCFATLTHAGAFLRVPRTLAEASELATYGSVYRYAAAVFNFEYVSKIGSDSDNCTRSERASTDEPVPLSKFCRWSNGSAYVEEIYPDGSGSFSETFNTWGMTIGLSSLALVVLICYATPVATRSANRFHRK